MISYAGAEKFGFYLINTMMVLKIFNHGISCVDTVEVSYWCVRAHDLNWVQVGWDTTLGYPQDSCLRPGTAWALKLISF